MPDSYCKSHALVKMWGNNRGWGGRSGNEKTFKDTSSLEKVSHMSGGENIETLADCVTVRKVEEQLWRVGVRKRKKLKMIPTFLA